MNERIEQDERCPCLFADEPCRPQGCACVKPHLSYACLLCVYYLRGENKKQRANELVRLVRPLPANPDARAIAEKIADGLKQNFLLSVESDYAYEITEEDLTAATNRITEILSTSLPRWIPIEQKPTARGMYRVTDSGEAHRAYYEPRQGLFTTLNGREYFTNVTAYMPEYEPEPYQPSKGETT